MRGRSRRLFQFRGKIESELFDIFYDLLTLTDGDEERVVPAKYQKIVRETVDLKTDIEFGYAYSLSQATHNQLLGSRAYQRALNRLQAEENARMRQERDAERLRHGG